jgi:hypothetical protein
MAARQGELISFLNEGWGINEALRGFSAADYIVYMGELKTRYRARILEEMKKQVLH